jgi:Site-specific recombinase XerD
LFEINLNIRFSYSKTIDFWDSIKKIESLYSEDSLDYTVTKRDKIIFMLLYSYGLRPTEALKLSILDFNFNEVENDIESFGSIYIKNSRLVYPLFPEVTKEIKTYLEVFNVLFNPSVSSVFTTTKGNKQYIIPHDYCSLCGNLSYIEARKDDKNYCSKCYKKYVRPKHVCSICSTIEYCYKKVDDKYICKKCYAKLYQPKHTCTICGIESASAKKESEKYYCKKCYTKYLSPKYICSKCGANDKAETIIDGKYICPKCYRKYYKPKTICALCGKLAPTAKLVNEKHICDQCYKKNYKPSQ